jgi:uncharacterized protein (DUF1330 family)
MVLIEFPSLERVVEFYNSDEYQAAIEVRRNAAIASFIALDGVS